MKNFLEKMKRRLEADNAERRAVLAARTRGEKIVERSLWALALLSIVAGFFAGMMMEGLILGFLFSGVLLPAFHRRGHWKTGILVGFSLISGVFLYTALAIVTPILQQGAVEEFYEQRAKIEEHPDHLKGVVDLFMEDYEKGYVGVVISNMDFKYDAYTDFVQNSFFARYHLDWIFSGMYLLLGDDMGKNDLLQLNGVFNGHRYVTFMNPMALSRFEDLADQISIERHGKNRMQLLKDGMADEFYAIHEEMPFDLRHLACFVDRHDKVLSVNSLSAIRVDLMRYPEIEPLIEICKKHGAYGGEMGDLPTWTEAEENVKRVR